MSLKGIRKTLNDDSDQQLASIVAAHHGSVPLRVTRYPRDVKAIYWLGSQKRWVGFEVKYVTVWPPGPHYELTYVEFDKKPRYGLVLGDGQPHSIVTRTSRELPGRRQSFKLDTVLFRRDNKYFYDGNRVIKLFKEMWAVTLTNQQLTAAQEAYKAREVNKGDSN